MEELIDIAKKAGKAILDVKEKKVEYKEDDSPLTEADKRSHEIITEELKKFSSYPVLSEESEDIPYSERKDWQKFWMIDPLDGTKEFVKENGEFTVNIALIEKGEPAKGVVYVPEKDTIYFSDGNKSYRNDKELPLNKGKDKMVVVASRSHFNEETKEFIENISDDYELISKGSSVKLCAVAEGSADVYPRLGPTMEWDTAAAHAIVKNAGRNVYDYNTGKELVYNKENLKNPWFVVR